MFTTASPAHENKNRVREMGLSLGFDLVHSAALKALDKEESHLREWLNRGYQAGMAWMERNAEKRVNPRLILPSAQSIIVLALNYDTSARHDKPSPPNQTAPNRQQLEGKISRYAWGDDYHDVMSVMLEQYCREMDSVWPEAEFKFYVDTGPVMEKQWAVLSGLGWQGKHSNIISKSHGSFVFLAVILTSLDLEADPQVADFCGSCTACLDACPTKAIVEPYVVDAGRCLSYWTIESKDPSGFPPEIAAHTEGWLYGCDICQDVCPWNRFRKDSQREQFQPRLGQTALDLNAVLSMQPENFRERFGSSPIKRTKLSGLQRNARVIEANTIPETVVQQDSPNLENGSA